MSIKANLSNLKSASEYGCTEEELTMFKFIFAPSELREATPQVGIVSRTGIERLDFHLNLFADSIVCTQVRRDDDVQMYLEIAEDDGVLEEVQQAVMDNPDEDVLLMTAKAAFIYSSSGDDAIAKLKKIYTYS